MTALQGSVALNIAQVVVLYWALRVLDKSVTVNRRLLGLSDDVSFFVMVRTWMTRLKVESPSPALGASPPTPPLNCHVASTRPVRARR